MPFHHQLKSGWIKVTTATWSEDAIVGGAHTGWWFSSTSDKFEFAPQLDRTAALDYLQYVRLPHNFVFAQWWSSPDHFVHVHRSSRWEWWVLNEILINRPSNTSSHKWIVLVCVLLGLILVQIFSEASSALKEQLVFSQEIYKLINNRPRYDGLRSV